MLGNSDNGRRGEVNGGDYSGNGDLIGGITLRFVIGKKPKCWIELSKQQEGKGG